MPSLSARGATVEAAFAALAVAMFGRIVDPLLVAEREVREVRAHGPTPEALLERWIDECLYVHEVEGFVPRRVEVLVWSGSQAGGAEPLRVHALLHGEPLTSAHAAAGPIGRDPAGPTRVAAIADGYEVTISLA